MQATRSLFDNSADPPEPERAAGMKIGAMAPWFGSKRTLALEIVRELGSHCSYWEPCCGSMAILLAKAACGMEVVNDLHRDLINLARVVASERAVELFEMAARTLMASDLFVEAKNACYESECEPAPSINEVTDAHVKRAWAFLVMSWQGRNGSSGTIASNITVARRFTHNGGSGGLRWRSAVDSIPFWHARLRSVQILNMDAFELLERVGDQCGSAIYLDPPYLKKGSKYLHDFTSDDHEHLASLLKRFKEARVVVSYYDDERLDTLYAGWTKRSVAISKALVNQGKRDQKGEVVKAPEVLLINGPSYASEWN
jgi:DNA adenine methylase